MVDDEEIAFEAEGRWAGKHDHAVGRRNHRSADPWSDIHAGMISGRLSAVYTL